MTCITNVFRLTNFCFNTYFIYLQNLNIKVKTEICFLSAYDDETNFENKGYNNV
jgi:hypothetical protein